MVQHKVHIYTSILLFNIITLGGIVSSNPWEDFLYAVNLDVAGKYWMFWTPDDDTQTITFEVC